MKHICDEVEKILVQTAEWGCGVSRHEASLLTDFALFLDSYEEANVIGARTLSEIVEEHILDSLSCLLFEPLKGAETLVDVGSGGGLPGIPLGIVTEGLQVSLVEATAKKARFLELATSNFGLSNIRTFNYRAEDAGRSEIFRQRYQVAVARAVARLEVLAEYCLPLVELGGHVIAMKGHIEKKELERGKFAAELLGAEISEVIEVSRLQQYEQKQRHLVVLTKTAQTPSKYPRRIGLPSKNPLS